MDRAFSACLPLGDRPDGVLFLDEINISKIASDRRFILGLKQWD
jgi:hypothetical protein